MMYVQQTNESHGFHSKYDFKSNVTTVTLTSTTNRSGFCSNGCVQGVW